MKIEHKQLLPSSSTMNQDQIGCLRFLISDTMIVSKLLQMRKTLDKLQNCKLTQKLLWYLLVVLQNVIKILLHLIQSLVLSVKWTSRQNEFLKQKSWNSNLYSNKQRYLLEQFV